MIQGKKFISPGAWFTMIYPSTWSEFEDGEGSFLFYNPDVWTGNFRISAFKADARKNHVPCRHHIAFLSRVPYKYNSARSRKCPLSYIAKENNENVYECPLKMRANCKLEIS